MGLHVTANLAVDAIGSEEGLDARAGAFELASFDGAAVDLPGPTGQGGARDRPGALGRREDEMSRSGYTERVARLHGQSQCLAVRSHVRTRVRRFARRINLTDPFQR